jgi:hypothetical protein
MSAVNTGGIIRINAGAARTGNLTVTVDEVDVTTIGATRPNPSWTATDVNGHFHAWDRDGKLPTLTHKTEREECDGSTPWHDEDCVPMERSWYECSVCGAVVTPDYIPDPGRKFVPGMTHWEVRVDIPWEEAMALQGQRVSVTFHRKDRVEAFGFAMFGSPSGYFGERVMAQVTLHGAGPLGRR